jgi:hypothetical protein
MIRSLIGLLIALAGPLPVAPTFPFFEPVRPPRSFQVVAHMGAAFLGCRSVRSTLKSAMVVGFKWVEVEIQFGKDEYHVIFHKNFLETTNHLSKKTLD